jgi:hypothetical protein
MSTIISLPIMLSEVTESTKRLPIIHPIKDPVSFPKKCVYCGAPKSKEVQFTVSTNTKIPRPGEASVLGGIYKVSAPYCDKHSKQSKTFEVLLDRIALIAFLLIGVPMGLATGIEFYQFFFAVSGDPTFTFVWSFIFGIAQAAFIAFLAMFGGKLILGLFVPAIKDYKIGSALGISVVIAGPKEKADLKTHTLDFTFTNEEYAKMFGEINQLSSEEMATIPSQLEAAEQARAAEADKRAVEARNVKTEALIGILIDKAEKIGSRRNSADDLGDIGDPKSIEPLIEALGDRDSALLGAAARALGKIGDDRAVEPLTETLKREGVMGAFARQEAAKALGLIGGNRSVEVLSDALTHKNYLFREVVARSLGEKGNIRALEPLTQALDDENKRVRKAAEEAMEKIESGTN